MSTVGFPDFQQQAQWQGSLIVTDGSFSLGANATKQYSFMPVASWLSCVYRICSGDTIGSGKDLVVNLQWFMTSGGLYQTGSKGFVIPAGQCLFVTVPNGGPFLTVRVTAGPNGATVNSVFVQPSNRSGTKWLLGQDPLIELFYGQVAAGSTTTVDAIGAFSGIATWAVKTDAADWNAELQWLDIVGNPHYIAGFGPAPAGKQPGLAQTRAVQNPNGTSALVAAPGAGKQIYVVSGFLECFAAGNDIAHVQSTIAGVYLMELPAVAAANVARAWPNPFAVGDNAALNLVVDTGTTGGFSALIDYYIGATAPRPTRQQAQVVIPPGHLQVVFVNNDTVARNVGTTVSANMID